MRPDRNPESDFRAIRFSLSPHTRGRMGEDAVEGTAAAPAQKILNINVGIMGHVDSGIPICCVSRPSVPHCVAPLLSAPRA
jgi:hypothetical protein